MFWHLHSLAWVWLHIGLVTCSYFTSSLPCCLIKKVSSLVWCCSRLLVCSHSTSFLPFMDYFGVSWTVVLVGADVRLPAVRSSTTALSEIWSRAIYGWKYTKYTYGERTSMDQIATVFLSFVRNSIMFVGDVVWYICTTRKELCIYKFVLDKRGRGCSRGVGVIRFIPDGKAMRDISVWRHKNKTTMPQHIHIRCTKSTFMPSVIRANRLLIFFSLVSYT